MNNAIHYFKQLSEILSLPSRFRKIIFYSEGPPHTPHLRPIVQELLKITDTCVTFVTSSSEDEVYKLTHSNLRIFNIGFGMARTIFFKLIKAQVIILSTPDLDTFHLKRSIHPAHYIYVQHSLVSLHMIYTQTAFDAYDEIFCSGPHHKLEIRAIEKLRNLPGKILFDHGYSRLDELLQRRGNTDAELADQNKIKSRFCKNILIAPSWGRDILLEAHGIELCEMLISQGHRVRLRPHPASLKTAKQTLQTITEKYEANPNFKIRTNVANSDDFAWADVMVSDWSGAAFEFAFGFSKPVLFIEVPKKINNPHYELIKYDPIEISTRSKIGKVIELDQLRNINSILLDFEERDAELRRIIKSTREQLVFNIGQSARKAAERVRTLVI